MKTLLIAGSFLILTHSYYASTNIKELPCFGNELTEPFNDDISRLISLLKKLGKDTENALLKTHFKSLVLMITDHTHAVPWTPADSLAASGVLEFFKHEGAEWETYSKGPRPLIMSFKSPSDGKSSFYWLFLPKDFDPDRNDYSFYMELHGSGGGKNDNPRNMLFRALQPEIKGVTAQGYRQEGIFIYPWGRGDKWYKDQAALDILECLEHFDGLFKTDGSKQYLYGFSMGGAGVFSIAQNTANRWSALGIYSGAFRGAVTKEAVAHISHLPVWITWGEEERLSVGNRQLRDYLIEAGAEVKWREVKGVGHSYLGEYQEELMNWFLEHRR